MRRTADVIVLGLGAMGAATLYQLAKRGVDAIGIDRFDPPHARGSSHGGSRLTREAVGEGPAYVPLARRSHQILAELEQGCGEALLIRSGMLIVGSRAEAAPMHGERAFLASSIDLAQRFGVKHEVMHAGELRRRYPQFTSIRDQDMGYLEPRSGYVRPEAAIATQLAAASGLGARTSVNTTVTAISQAAGVVRLQTRDGAFEAARVVVSAGAWSRGLLGAPFDRLLSVTRQRLHWYQAEDYAPFQPGRFPTVIWFRTDRLEDYFTAFPVTNPAEGIKVTRSDEGPHVDHDTVDMTVPPEESHGFYRHHLAANLAGVTPRVLGAATCFYTMTPDNGFIIDEHPAMDRVTVVSACSGHGFKHSPAIGEAVAQRVRDGRSAIDLSAFALARFA